MSKSGSVRLIVSGLWVALVAGYWIWAVINYSGLYRWLAEWQIAQFGGYYERVTAILPALLMSGPALVYLRRRAETAQAEAAAQLGAEVAQGRQLRRSVWGTAAFGLVAILVGGGAFLLSQSVPDGSGPATPFDAATLGTAPLPSDLVTIRGDVDSEASVALTETRAGSSRGVVYAGFHPEGENAKEAPVRLFIERSTGSGTPTMSQGFLPEQTGFLGFVCLLVAGIMAIQGRALLRRA